ncbi:MAG TPA: helix-turn-helix domain-containing protein [Bacteroidales bacterium]|nr:helix-turn-helix domain-containing protein [Bacteroidales bacterium]
MSKLTIDDLPAAVEALLLRMDILHDLVKSTRDTLYKLIAESNGGEINKIKLEETASQETIPESEQLLNIGKAARFLGITNTQLYLAAEKQQIAHFRKLNQIYFKKADLEAYKEKQPKSTGPTKPLQDEPTIVLGEDNDKLLSTEEAVEYTGFTRSYLYSYIKSRKLPFVKKGRRLYFPLVALNQVIIMSMEKQTRPKAKRKKPAS